MATDFNLNDRSNLLNAIGETPIVKLNKVVPYNAAEVWVKLEGLNPTGSYKDRMAVSILSNALMRGDVKPGENVVEYTGGSTGSALAFACACSGIKFTAIFSDAFSHSKQLAMEAIGAEVIVVPSYGKGISPELIKKMKELAHEKVDKINGFYADQFGSKDVVLGYQPMGFEIAQQIEGKVDLLCASVGTGGALMGTLEGLNKKDEFPNVIAFEPSQCLFLI